MELNIEELFIYEPFWFEGTPFEVNRVVVLMWIASIACIAFFGIGALRTRLVPRGVHNVAETAYLFVRNNIAIDMIGPKDGVRFAPYLAAVFFFIFFSNLLEIVPGVNFPVTSRMAIPGFLAILTWLIFNGVGIKRHGFGYFRNVLFPPGVPLLIKPLLAVIEAFSVFIIRPLTLAVRLLANMMAGHVLLTIFFLFTAQFLERLTFATPLFIVTLVVACALIVFELLVISIQAYIFTMLSAFYIAEAIHGHAEHDEATTDHEGRGHEVEGVAA